MKYNLIKKTDFSSEWTISAIGDDEILAIIHADKSGHPFSIHFLADLFCLVNEIIKDIKEAEKAGAFKC